MTNHANTDSKDDVCWKCMLCSSQIRVYKSVKRLQDHLDRKHSNQSHPPLHLSRIKIVSLPETETGETKSLISKKNKNSSNKVKGNISGLSDDETDPRSLDTDGDKARYLFMRSSAHLAFKLAQNQEKIKEAKAFIEKATISYHESESELEKAQVMVSLVNTQIELNSRREVTMQLAHGIKNFNDAVLST